MYTSPPPPIPSRPTTQPMKSEATCGNGLGAFCHRAITSPFAKTAAPPPPSQTFPASASLTPVPPSFLLTGSPQCMSLCAGSAAAGELTLFVGLPGAAVAGLPARPAPQPGRLSKLLRVAARLGRRRHRRVLHPHAEGGRLRGWPSQLQRRWPGARSVSGCHSDCDRPRPQQLSAAFSPAPGVLRAQEGAEVRGPRLVTDRSKGFAVNLSFAPHVSLAREALLFPGRETKIQKRLRKRSEAIQQGSGTADIRIQKSLAPKPKE